MYPLDKSRNPDKKLLKLHDGKCAVQERVKSWGETLVRPTVLYNSSLLQAKSYSNIQKYIVYS